MIQVSWAGLPYNLWLTLSDEYAWGIPWARVSLYLYPFPTI